MMIRTFLSSVLLALTACQAGVAEPSAVATKSPAPALTCPVGQRTCFRCNDGTPFCAIRCPECAPLEADPDAPASTLALACQ
ncbi:MAG TPA: hypothetical protein VFP84_28185 [Kofleriaceae bacterium]|nr:hypothetical protein [Kofleriaceae bacterium]